MKPWQRTQTEVSKFLGAKETGEKGKSIQDAIHPCFVIEIKYKKEIPKWIINILKQAERHAKTQKLDLPPIGIIHPKGKHIKNSIVFMRLEDFQGEMGEVKFDGLGLA